MYNFDLLSFKKKCYFHFIKIIVTFFYSGLSIKAPGTAGSFAAIIFLCFLYNITGNLDYILLFPFNIIFLVCLYIVGYLTTSEYLSFTNKHDPKEVVIDEVIGQYIPIILVWPLVLKNFDTEDNSFHVFILITLPCFILFRIFDIWKPSLIGLIDRKINNAHGVMLDDVAAGFFSAVTLYVFYLCYKLTAFYI